MPGTRGRGPGEGWCRGPSAISNEEPPGPVLGGTKVRSELFRPPALPHSSTPLVLPRLVLPTQTFTRVRDFALHCSNLMCFSSLPKTYPSFKIQVTSCLSWVPLAFAGLPGPINLRAHVTTSPVFQKHTLPKLLTPSPIFLLSSQRPKIFLVWEHGGIWVWKPDVQAPPLPNNIRWPSLQSWVWLAGEISLQECN